MWHLPAQLHQLCLTVPRSRFFPTKYARANFVLGTWGTMPKRGIESYFEKATKRSRVEAGKEGEELPVGRFADDANGQKQVENDDFVEKATDAVDEGKTAPEVDGQTEGKSNVIGEKSGEEGGEGSDGMTVEERRRVLANRNSAKARQVVAAAVKEGQHPKLRDLLVEDSWMDKVSGEFKKSYFKSLEEFVQGEWSGPNKIFPPAHDIFRALNSSSFDSVKVVIIGQDPYHGPNQAMGLSFSVPRAQKIPSSLQNMYKEIVSDMGGTKPTHGDLTQWAMQGVMLLNTVLTVQASKANSHKKKGWEEFTDAVIQKLNDERKGLVFMLWGRHAQAKGKQINRKRHLVLETVHPSGLSANKGFFGCKHFSKGNQYIEDQGLDPIEWQIGE